MRWVLAAIAAWVLMGCFSLGGRPLVAGEDIDPACEQLDEGYVAWAAVASTAAGLSGASGLVLASWPDPSREERIGLGAAGAVLGVLATTAQLLSDSYATRWADRCR